MHKLILAGIILAVGTGFATAAPRQGVETVPKAKSQPVVKPVATPAQTSASVSAPVAAVVTPVPVQQIAPVAKPIYDYGN